MTDFNRLFNDHADHEGFAIDTPEPPGTHWFEAFLEASNHFPEKLQKALSALHDKHHATLVTKGVLAQEAEVLDLTPELFTLMGIEPQATRQAHEALRKSLFQRERH